MKKYKEKLEKFKKSLKRINNKQLLTLYRIIDNQRIDGEPTVEEYFKMINNKNKLNKLC